MKRWGLALVLGWCVSVAWAQVPTAEEAEKVANELHWLAPGEVGKLGTRAVFRTSEQYTFLDNADTDRFLVINGNPPRKTSVTIAPVQGEWFGILDFDESGYVKDDDKIDADDLLAALKKDNVEANADKKRQGFPTITLEDWALPPRYDKATHRLEWGTRLRTDDGRAIVNVSTRILGRRGVTSAVLVTDVETLEKDLADFKLALKDFEYVDGERYSEWKEGDKVAAYGLGALVLGGAAAAATSKFGLKAIGLAIAGAAAAAWAGVKRLFGRGGRDGTA